MRQLSKKEMNRMYGKTKKKKDIRRPKNEPYKRNKLDVREFQKKEKKQ